MATVDYVHDLAFPKLSVSEVEWLAGLATICSFKDGELVFQAGNAACLSTSSSRARSPSWTNRRTSRRRSSSTARASSPATSHC